MSILSEVKRYLAIMYAPTAQEVMLKKARAEFQENNVIVRGTIEINKWLAVNNKNLRPIRDDGKSILPFRPISINNKVFLGEAGGYAFFMLENPHYIYAIKASDFNLEVSLDAMAIGMANAGPMVKYAQNTMMFSCKLFGGFLGVGYALTIVNGARNVTAAAHFCFQNEEQFQKIRVSLKQVWSDLKYFKDQCPDVFKALMAVLSSGETIKVSPVKYIEDLVMSKSDDIADLIGGLLAQSMMGASEKVAAKSALKVAWDALMDLKSLLDRFNDGKAIGSGQKKGAKSEDLIAKAMASHCSQSPEVKAKIKATSKNLDEALKFLEEMKKQMSS